MSDEQAKENLITAFISLAEAINALATSNQTAVLAEISALKDEIAKLTAIGVDIENAEAAAVAAKTAAEQASASVNTLTGHVLVVRDNQATILAKLDALSAMVTAISATLDEVKASLPVPPVAEPEEPTDPIDPPIDEPVDPEEPTDPETPEVPEEPSPVLPIYTMQFPDFTTGEWQGSISKQESRFIVDTSTQHKEVFKVGNVVKFSNGDRRKIVSVLDRYNKLFVGYEGPKLSPEDVGHPHTIEVFASVETPAEPSPTPEQPSIQRKGQMGTALGMGMGYPQAVPGEMGYNYQLPTEDDVRRAIGYGMKLFRLGSLRERLIKPGLKSELYLGTDARGKPYSLPKIREFLKFCNSVDCKVMLDLFHNYGGFSEGNNASTSNNPQHKKIGTSDGPSYDVFANDWKAIIKYLKEDTEAWNAVYGVDVMNEWVGLPSDNIFYASQRFLDVCAPVMDDKLAVFEGNAYSNTPNFWQHNPRFKDLVDPRGPGFIEMSGHLYADADYSGMYKTGDTVRAGENFDTFYINRVKPFLDGCEQYGFSANIGEWIVPGDHPKLLEGSRIGIEYALSRGCNMFVFGMGRGYSTAESNHWNLEIDRNKPTLEVVKRLAALR